MSDPFKDALPVQRAESESLLSTEEIIALEKARNDRRIQWAFMTVVAIAALSLIIPMGVWLTRLALGQ
jgi:hypothetical protein